MSDRIDIHSHLLPGIDDGCADLDESLACVRSLIEAGFVGSVCTPHIWVQMFPDNLPDRIAQRTAALQTQLQQHNLDYQLWPGGEVRLFDGIIEWFAQHGVPTLANSRCVLVDFWEMHWPDWVKPALGWLIERDYQPILAHPERIPGVEGLNDHLLEVKAMGVLLQCNARSMTGEEGYHADHLVRQLLAENRCDMIALDMHRPDSLEARLSGLELVAMEYTPDMLEQLISQKPREILGLP